MIVRANNIAHDVTARQSKRAAATLPDCPALIAQEPRDLFCCATQLVHARYSIAHHDVIAHTWFITLATSTQAMNHGVLF